MVRTLPAVVSFYVGMAEAENHAVREAACLCAGELAAKLPTAALKPHASSLVAALTDCLDDQSWPVREGACTACAQLLDHFAPECAVQLPALLRTFWEQLADNTLSRTEGMLSASCSQKVRRGAGSWTAHSGAK